MDYEVSYDISRFMDASVHEVIKIYRSIVAGSLCCFVFLQDWRSTLIPALRFYIVSWHILFMQFVGFLLT